MDTRRIMNKILLANLMLIATTFQATLASSVEVIDPYVEIHAGPGRGYPIFHVVEQGETIKILTRRPDWYELKTQNGQIGWATAASISRTLEPTGEPVDLPTVSYGDYLKNSFRIGYTNGQFSRGELESADSFTFSIGYRPFSFFTAELEAGKLYATEVKGNYGNLNAIFEPFSQWKVSPFVLFGGGLLSVSAQPTFPNTTSPFIGDNVFYTAAIGASYYVGRNFIVNFGYRWFFVDLEAEDPLAEEDSLEGLQRWYFGFNVFF